jgi:hypothetical protein
MKSNILESEGVFSVSTPKKRFHWLYGFLWQIKLEYSGDEQLGLSVDDYCEIFDKAKEVNNIHNSILIVKQASSDIGFEVG